ncbi:MAG: hypothetical protein MJA29_07070, partial [Candidatus Omnitrophica bacterium]|nr:hypothetical protein [Candidatus Omnitrophota bacterium]
YNRRNKKFKWLYPGLWLCPNSDIADDVTCAFPERVQTFPCKRNKIDFFHTVFERVPVIARVEVEPESVKPVLI